MNFLAANDLIRYIPSEWIVCFVLFLGIAVYMLPTWIAGFTKHPDTVGIAVVNAVFGWSGIGFLLCLIWAFRKPQQALPTDRAAHLASTHFPTYPCTTQIHARRTVVRSGITQRA